MNIYDIECFVTLANMLNFTKAAEFMNITQPAFSRHIFSMENELNATLFLRNKRSVILTETGRAFLEESKHILDHYYHGLSKVDKVIKGVIGSIKIGILSEQFHPMLSESICNFRFSYPDINVEILEYTNSAMISALQNNEIDIAFTISPGISIISDIIWKSNMTFEQAVVLPRNHPLASKSCITVLDLKDEDFIFFDTDEFSYVNEITQQICLENNLNPRIIKRASSINSLMTLVECGTGISIVPYHFKDLYLHKVNFIKLTGQLKTVERVFAWRKCNFNPCLPIFLQELMK